jgi:ribosomal RNA-processing protein 1
MRIWKGLFYCVWMSDKPLIQVLKLFISTEFMYYTAYTDIFDILFIFQESCVNDVSNLIHCFNNFSDACMFIRCFFQAISQAWYGLDQHRLDKFMMVIILIL